MHTECLQPLPHQYDSVTFGAQCSHCCCQALQLCLLLRQLSLEILTGLFGLLGLETPAGNRMNGS
jgi:hypothetical protein